MADLFPIFTVHCFTCPHLVRATTPSDAHDAMEQHYTDRHAALIGQLAGAVTPGGGRG